MIKKKIVTFFLYQPGCHRPILALDCVSGWYWSQGVISGSIWKMPCIKSVDDIYNNYSSLPFLLKVALNTINQTKPLPIFFYLSYYFRKSYCPFHDGELDCIAKKKYMYLIKKHHGHCNNIRQFFLYCRCTNKSQFPLPYVWCWVVKGLVRRKW